MTGLLLAAALALGAPADLPPAACVPVQVEAPLSLPRSDRTGPGCIAYQRVPRSGDGDATRVLVFGDPQVKSARDVDYFRRDIVAPLLGQHDATLGITLGDLVDDVPTLLPDVKAATASLGIPWLHAPGNHDVDPARPATSIPWATSIARSARTPSRARPHWPISPSWTT